METKITKCIHSYYILSPILLLQVIDDFVKRVNGTEIAIISQEIFQHDPYTRVENLKVKLGNRL